MNVDRVRKVYSNGRHNLCVGNIVRWRGAYYVCFVDAAYHGSNDATIRILSSSDLETWRSHVALGATSFDPQLLPVGDTLYLYAVTADWSQSDFVGVPSWEVVASTTDGTTWSAPKRCFVANHDFWTPTGRGSRYYVACDNCGHVPEGAYGTVDLLTSTDGERWSWVSELLHGSEVSTLLNLPDTNLTKTPSEAALTLLDDGRLLAVIRTKAQRAVLATSDPPYERWTHHAIPFALHGANIANVGGQIVVAGRCRDDHNEYRTGVFRYVDDGLTRGTLLPSGGDTGYAGTFPLTEREVLIAYYSSHEYPEHLARWTHGPADIYLARVTLR
jgi:hypothetical protein